MKFCITHFASILFRFFFQKFYFQNCCMEYYWCYLDAVCTILQRIQFSTKKNIQHFYIGTILFQKIKSYGRWLAEKQTVKLYLVPRVRNQKFYLVPGVRNGKIDLVSNDSYKQIYLAIKGLIILSPLFCYHLKSTECLQISAVSYTSIHRKHLGTRGWCQGEHTSS